MICVRIETLVFELRQQLLYTLPAVARKAVKGAANGFVRSRSLSKRSEDP
jgi:hypothetical protein